jgi:hypothetical protein
MTLCAGNFSAVGGLTRSRLPPWCERIAKAPQLAEIGWICKDEKANRV